MNILLNVKSLYWIWFILHVVLFIMSGWLQNFFKAFLKMQWDKTIIYNDKFYPFNNATLADYDATEFFAYILAPLVLYSLLARIFGR